MYLLDTNACIQILNGRSDPLIRRVRGTHPSQIVLCSIVKAELIFGAHNSSRKADNLRILKEFFAPFVSLPFDDRCIDHYGQVRQDLESEGTPIGPNDLLIASTALAHALTLITSNQREFSRVAGLDTADWTTPE